MDNQTLITEGKPWASGQQRLQEGVISTFVFPIHEGNRLTWTWLNKQGLW